MHDDGTTDTDGLTGVPRKSVALAMLQGACAQASESHTPLAVAFVDLDRFKDLNDGRGHRVADEALVMVARAIGRCLKDHDRVGRYGGDEFLVLLPGVSRHDLQGRLEEIRRQAEAAEEPGADGAGPIRVTVSVGGATLPEDGPAWTSLLESADRGLYEAKKAGRNRVVVAPPVAV